VARRRRVADAVQAEVLVKSRRRCCVCYGLNRDADTKQGQIAHLDKNRANNPAPPSHAPTLCPAARLNRTRYGATSSLVRNVRGEKSRGRRYNAHGYLLEQVC
jgi:hypothetical protein